MSEYLYCNLFRPGASGPYAKSILIQANKVEAKEAAEFKGVNPHFVYRMFTRQLPTSDPELVQQRDLVIDQQIIDPTTNKLRQYRIISDPAPKVLMMAWEWLVEKSRGT